MSKPIRIVRAAHDSKYFAASRETAQDKSLSLEARGVLFYLLSKPDDWELQPKDLAQGIGINKVYKLLRELDTAGYIVRTDERDTKKRFVRFVYTVYERPVNENHQMAEKPFDEKPQVEKPFVENHHLTEYREVQSTEKKKTPAPKNGADAAVNESEKKAHVRDPIFDAVALVVFGINDDKVEGGRVAKISNWLNGKFQGRGAQKVGFISHPAEVKHIEAFAADCAKRGITPPLDLVKFVENWRAWASRATQPKAAPPEVLKRPDAVPQEWGVNQFIREAVTHE